MTAGLLLALAGLWLVALAGFVALRLRGAPARREADPGYRPTPVELSAMTGNSWSMLALALMELREAGVLTPDGRHSGLTPSRPVSPHAQALRPVVEAPPSRRSRLLGQWFATMRQSRRELWRQLHARGLADSGQLHGRLRTVSFGLGLGLGLSGVALAAVMLTHDTTLLVLFVVAVVLAMIVSSRLRAPTGLTPAGLDALRRAQRELAPHDPRATPVPPAVDASFAAYTVAVLGIGALHRWAPSVALAAGDVPQAELLAPFALPGGAASARSAGDSSLDSSCGGTECGSSCSGGGCGGDGGGCGGD